MSSPAARGESRPQDRRRYVRVIAPRARGAHCGRMSPEDLRKALDSHWQASAAGDADAEHDIYHDDVVCEYPQSGERILGRANLQALRTHHPGKPAGFHVRRITGSGEIWV